MPKEEVVKRAKEDARAGKSVSTQAGEFVREEIEEVRHGEHGVRSPAQAIAIGLSKARRAGVKLPPYEGKGAKSSRISSKGSKNKTPGSSSPHRNQKKMKPSARRSSATLKALKREPQSTVSHHALSKHSQESAQRRGPVKRHLAALKAVRTKGHKRLVQAARKAARTRQAHAP